MHRLSALFALIALLYLASAASAIIVITSSTMDYVLTGAQDPSFDDKADGTAAAPAPVEFHRGNDSILSPDSPDAQGVSATWNFKGQMEFTPAFISSSGLYANTMQKTEDEQTLKVTREIVNNTGQAFAAYVVGIDKAELDGNVLVTGVDVAHQQVRPTDYVQGYRQTFVEIDFKDLLQPGQSFTVEYTLNLHRIANATYVEPNEDFSDQNGWSGGQPYDAPEPATMTLLGVGSLLAFLRRNRQR